jgi:ribosomal protein S18 acetylase RimI-like enzyme
VATEARLPIELKLGGVTTRPEADDDEAFLMRLFASTKERELAFLPFTDDQKRAFLFQQFDAQRRHYRSYGALLTSTVIEQDGAPIGRLYLDETPTHLHVVDITLLPEWRGRGVGGAVIEALQTAARAAAKAILLSVDKTNPALRLYRRLGFTETADRDLQWEMEWSPATMP